MPKHLYSTLSEAVEGLRRLGFAANFMYDEKTRTIAAEGHSYKGEDLRIVDHYRFEGMSDPNDSSVLYALEGPDGTRGLLVAAYGAYADAGLGAALKKTKDSHGEET
jgi:hypothetical protein